MDNRDVLLIQDNDDGTFSWSIPELDIVGTKDDANDAMEEALEAIALNPTISRITPQDEARVAAIGKRVAVIKREIESLEQEAESLKQIIPVVAHELLEDTRTVEGFVRFLFLDHPAEEFLGEIKTVGFYPSRDRDGDGVPDAAPSLYTGKMIENVPQLSDTPPIEPAKKQ